MAPLNYAAFLTYLDHIGVMRRVGGGFAIPHNLIRDHIARLTREELEALIQPAD
ncbi:MAG: hypothetical protein ACFB51_19480 [Anaerolineae bacterium]